MNSRARRKWVAEAADIPAPGRRPHETYFTSFGDLTAIYRTLGVPLRDTLTGDNDVRMGRGHGSSRLFLHADWAVVTGGDEVQSVIDRAGCRPALRTGRRIIVKGAPVIEIYQANL